MKNDIPITLKEKLNEIREKLNLKENILKKAYHIYHKAKSKLALIGFSFTEIAAGIIFVASIVENEPIPIYKISKASEIKSKIIWSVSASLQKAGIVQKVSRIPDILSIIKDKTYGKLKEEDINELVKFIEKNVVEIKRKVGSINSRAVAGAIIWMLSKKKIINKRITQREIASLFETNEVSIRISAKRLENLIKIYA